MRVVFHFVRNLVFKIPCKHRCLSGMASLLAFTRGTQRLFSVKYLFGEANNALNFLLLEDD